MIERLIADMTLEEKASITSGHDMWSTVAIDRLGIPALRLTDGHNGVRGAGILGASGKTSVCVPCGSALGATWDPGLVERIGALVGEEARRKGCRVLLAPTANLHRSPLAGRNFECYSEDPLLAGELAAAYVRGAQSRGVATTVKHFAGNEAETARFTDDSVIDERALREIYLVPFELAVRKGGAHGVMTAYNRLNGHFCGEHEELLGILRNDWAFAGFVVSDWYAAGSTVGSARAGLDLEMPGPARFYGPPLAEAVAAGEVDESVLDAQVHRLLSLIDRLDAWDDRRDEQERSVDEPEERALVREAAAAGIVLLQNDGVLPLAGEQTIAVIGPNAARAQIMGGGSAALNPHYLTTPVSAIRAACGAARVRYARGADAGDVPPWLPITLDIEYTDGEGAVVDRGTLSGTRIVFLGPAPAGFRARGGFDAEEPGAYTFTFSQAGRARVRINDDVVFDGFAAPPAPGGAGLYGFGSAEVSVAVVLRMHNTIDIEYAGAGADLVTGIEIGCQLPVRGDLLDEAVAAARGADIAVVVVGTTDRDESEDHDRTQFELPGEQETLIRAVAAANPRTVVVVNTGTAVAMEWADEVAAVVQVWFGGQEMAAALADVLTGAAEPGGRLPITIPRCIEQSPAYGNFPGSGGRTVYGEGVFVGYRWFDARRIPVRFPFGHGLSYTSFAIGAPRVTGDRDIEVDVTNTGDRRGAEVIQCYVAPPPADVVPPTLGNAQWCPARPPAELRAFAKVWLDAGETATVRFALDDRAFAYWRPSVPDWEAIHEQVLGCNPEVRPTLAPPPPAGWVVEAGVYTVAVGRSSAATVGSCQLTIG